MVSQLHPGNGQRTLDIRLLPLEEIWRDGIFLELRTRYNVDVLRIN